MTRLILFNDYKQFLEVPGDAQFTVPESTYKKISKKQSVRTRWLEHALKQNDCEFMPGEHPVLLRGLRGVRKDKQGPTNYWRATYMRYVRFWKVTAVDIKEELDVIERFATLARKKKYPVGGFHFLSAHDRFRNAVCRLLVGDGFVTVLGKKQTLKNKEDSRAIGEITKALKQISKIEKRQEEANEKNNARS